MPRIPLALTLFAVGFAAFQTDAASAESLHLRILSRTEHGTRVQSDNLGEFDESWRESHSLGSYEHDETWDLARLAAAAAEECSDDDGLQTFFSIDHFFRLEALGSSSVGLQGSLAAEISAGETIAWAQLCSAAHRNRARELTDLATITK